MAEFTDPAPRIDLADPLNLMRHMAGPGAVEAWQTAPGARVLQDDVARIAPSVPTSSDTTPLASEVPTLVATQKIEACEVPL
ncbi:MAG: hypothetical protein ACKO2K_15795 [Alphaproteobacteria bacterium]